MSYDPNDPDGDVQTALGIGCIVCIITAVCLVALAAHLWKVYL